MRIKKLLPVLLFVNQFDIVDEKTGEVYFTRCFNTSKHSISQRKLERMELVKIESEDKGRFTIWVKWYK